MKKNVSSQVVFILMAALVIGVTGLFSLWNLMKFYVHDEVVYNEWNADFGSKFETDVASTFFKKFQFINLNGAVRRLLGQHEMNGVIKLQNGYLTQTNSRLDDEFLSDCANNVALLNELLKADWYWGERDTEPFLLYAVTPDTIGKYAPQLPAGISDYGNDNIDRFMKILEEKGIDTIDFRETMHDDGINHYEMMYKTDHHWNTRAGFYAYGLLADYIATSTGCEVETGIADIQNYTVTTYKKWHLGSRGQRTGIYFAGIDDFELFVPAFETLIKNDSGVTGSMPELVYNMRPLQNKDYTSRYTYDWVLGNSLGHYVNLKSKNDIRILIVSDSFAKAVNPYLILGFAEVRYIYDLDVSDVTRTIESYDPDVVILMYYKGCFFKNSYDFF